jgi:UDP-glucose 4-epimerase
VKYFVSGGAGFIGSYLVEELVAQGNSLYVLDDLSSGSKNNLSKILNKIAFYQGSILDSRLINKLVKKCDFVIHLGAVLGVHNIINKPLHSLTTNIHGTSLILDSAYRYEKPVLFASTSEIYGKNNKVPLNEVDDRILGHPLKSRWSYSEAKAVDESLAYFYYLEKKLPIRIVRLFNTVGPRQVGHYGMVVPRFVSSALKNEPLTVYGSGEQIRCFCHIQDVIRALIMILNSEKTIGEVFNVGNNVQTSIMDLARKVIEITGSKSQIEKIPYSEAYSEGFEDMQRRVPDISKIKLVLGWEPEINLDQIIKDVAAYHSK